MYYLKVISLEGCPYSEAANNLVKNNNIRSEIVIVKHSEKEKFKTDEINTFPQIYLKKRNSSGNQLIGGYTDIKSYYDLIHSSKNDLEIIKNKIKEDNKYLSDRSILRLIELLV